MKQYDKVASIEGGFQPHPEGKYVLQIEEGIRKQKGTKDDPNDNRRSLLIPLISIYTIEGEPNSHGQKLNWFATLRSSEGKINVMSEKTLYNILNWNNRLAKFQNFPDSMDYCHPDFVNQLLIDLPGCKFAGTVTHREYQGRVNADVSTWNDPNEYIKQSQMEMNNAMHQVKQQQQETQQPQPQPKQQQALPESDW